MKKLTILAFLTVFTSLFAKADLTVILPSNPVVTTAQVVTAVTNTTPTVTFFTNIVSITNSPTLQSVYNAVGTTAANVVGIVNSNGGFNQLPTNKWTVAPYVTYAPSALKKIGGGVFIAYKVNNNVSAGAGLDYLGNLTMPSGQLNFQVPIHPLSFVGLTNVLVTPFGFAGIAVPVFGGSGNSPVIGIAGAGFSAKLADFTLFGKAADVTIGGAAVKWSGTSGYDGVHYELFPAFHLYF